MYRCHVVVCLLFQLISSAHAQWDVRSIALSNSQLQSPGEIHSGPINPAGLSWSRSTSVALSVMPAPFDIPGLRRFGIAIGLPFDRSGALWSVTGMGGELVRRLEMRASYGARFTETVGFGVSIIGEHWIFQHVGVRRTLGLELGTMLNSGPVSIGMNSSVHPFESHGEALKAMTVAAAIRPSDQTSVFAEAEQARFHALTLRFGLIHRLIESISLYAGWSEEPDLISGGISMSLAGIETMYGGQWHSELGWVHAFGIVWNLSD